MRGTEQLCYDKCVQLQLAARKMEEKEAEEKKMKKMGGRRLVIWIANNVHCTAAFCPLRWFLFETFLKKIIRKRHLDWKMAGEVIAKKINNQPHVCDHYKDNLIIDFSYLIMLDNDEPISIFRRMTKLCAVRISYKLFFLQISIVTLHWWALILVAWTNQICSSRLNT